MCIVLAYALPYFTALPCSGIVETLVPLCLAYSLIFQILFNVCQNLFTQSFV